MDAIDLLIREHDVIQRGLYLLRVTASRIEGGGDVPGKLRSWMVDFFRTFADRCHHAKEERVLFPLLVVPGGREAGRSIEDLVAEHEAFRGYLARLERADLANERGREVFVETAHRYVEHLRAHIWEENNQTFVRARETLSPGQMAGLTQAFAAAERACGAEDCLDRYRPALKRWEAQVCTVP